jgi:hypothetical protein
MAPLADISRALMMPPLPCRAVLLLLLPLAARGCSNIIVSPGASADGSSLLGDNDDSGSRHGLVTHFGAANHSAGALREVYHFETGERLGAIPQPAHTYNVMAHANDQVGCWTTADCRRWPPCHSTPATDATRCSLLACALRQLR